ncbi:SDR family oxidoreductase [Streptomyces sp. PSKA54]|uniref:SDR family oxidoreductase n=1 Tax=Streptomyces himalayensis subsp. aureolus TaxID=2758039 RepID=A0A7W2D2S7_9ACTN|nr:SDR family oxidoreductase [Streptomyces himalayensis]MBA4863591.1 SDR family oxidoreductase [Streptomyces himalayensis subsp. aureolus]
MTSTDQSPVPAYQELLRLDGRNLVVVGAGQGMGRQTSHALAQCGARVVCVDIDKTLAHEIAEEVNGVAWTGDVTKDSEVARLVEETTAALGAPLGGFVDIVGLAEWVGALELEEKTWDSQFDICLRHAYLLSRHIGRHMVDTGTPGTMVFIASVHGLTASVRHGAYGAAKAGLISWVRTLGNELGAHGIRVNAVAPGSIITPRLAAAHKDETRQERTASLVPLGRMGLPFNIASAALFLTSELSAYMTGQTVVVDGGVTIKDPFPSL